MGDDYEKWQLVTVEELQAFMGFMIQMGLVRLPALSDYWSKNSTYHYLPIASRINRTRFFEIQRYLHFADNTVLASPGSEHYDK